MRNRHGGIIDSHVHLWPESRAAVSRTAGLHKHLFREFTGEDLDAAAPTDIGGVLLVEHGGDGSIANSALRELADTTTLTMGLVGWSDLVAEDAAEKLTTLFSDPLFVAARTVPGSDGHRWLAESAEALALLEQIGRPLELLADPSQWSLCAELAASHPGLTVIVEHVGLVTSESVAGLALLAAQRNIYAKLSAFPLDSPDTLRDIIDSFGPDRIMFGSNWPVSLGIGSYADIVDCAVAACAGLRPASRDQILHGTAAGIYRIT